MSEKEDKVETEKEPLLFEPLDDVSDEKTVRNYITDFYKKRYGKRATRKFRYDVNLYKKSLDLKKDSEVIKRLYRDLIYEFFPGASLRKERADIRVLDEYWVYEPYVKIAILSENGDIHYHVTEPHLNAVEKAQLSALNELMYPEIRFDFRSFESKEETEEFLRELVKGLVKKNKLLMDEATLSKLLYYIVRDSVYFEKIDPLMRDPGIEDVSCNGPNVPIYVFHRKHQSIPTDIMFDDFDELNQFVIRLAYMGDKTISLAKPYLDASLPDQSRIQLTLGKEITPRGPSFTIRRFRENPLTITDLISYNTLSSSMAAWYWYLMENKASSLVVGGTASGKTTTVNVLSMFLKPTIKIVTIEDTAELQLPHENWISSVTRAGTTGSEGSDIDLYQLLRQAMRQRPEFLIVGEVRGAEAYTLFQAIATGHGGLATIHADSITAVIRRLEGEPMNIPRPLLVTLDAVVIQSQVKLPDRMVRRIMGIYEIVGLNEEGNVLTNEVFRWDAETDSYSYGGHSYILEKIADRYGLQLDEVEQEVAQRRQVIDLFVEKNVKDYRKVVSYLNSYYSDPEKLMEKLREL